MLGKDTFLAAQVWADTKRKRDRDALSTAPWPGRISQLEDSGVKTSTSEKSDKQKIKRLLLQLTVSL